MDWVDIRIGWLSSDSMSLCWMSGASRLPYVVWHLFCLWSLMQQMCEKCHTLQMEVSSAFSKNNMRLMQKATYKLVILKSLVKGLCFVEKINMKM